MSPRGIALVGLVSLLASQSIARAEIEIGGYLGGSFVSPRLLLGRVDGKVESRALSPMASFGFRVEYLPTPRWGAELELGVIPTGTRDGASRVTLVTLHGHAILNLLTGRVRPFLLLGPAMVASSPSNPLAFARDVEPALDGGVGLRADLGSWWGIRIDGRVLMARGAEDPVAFLYEGRLGLYGRFPAPPEPPRIIDRDEDGVVDGVDRCPRVAGVIRNHGCPIEPVVAVAPAPKEITPPPAPALSPPPPPPVPKPVVVAAPAPSPAPAPAPVAPPDRDHDGIPDSEDKCPDLSGGKDRGGCPEKVPDLRRVAKVTSKIDFDVASATLTPSSSAELDRIVLSLRDDPQLRLEISGHSDNRGSVRANVALSLKRAEAVRRYFVSHGVAPDRLTAVGRGPDEPIADNETPEGRGKNRRVEFRNLDEPGSASPKGGGNK